MIFSEAISTTQNVERARQSPELQKYKEVELKLLPYEPQLLEATYRPLAADIEQLYLSTPADEFSLRLRRETTPAGETYTATLKDRGTIEAGALARQEIECVISQEVYEHYRARDIARVTKKRFDYGHGVALDFYADPGLPRVMVEVEAANSLERQALATAVLAEAGCDARDVSGDYDFTSEALAYKASGRERDATLPERLEDFAERVVRDMVAWYVAGRSQVVVGLTGMSGSGKTTVTRAISRHMKELFGEEYAPLVLSTDDYHFGKTALEAVYGSPYSAWDDARTYDTQALAADLRRLGRGEPIVSRKFDFQTQEPRFGDQLAATPFVVVEGLYAGSRDLADVRTLHHVLPTGIATSVGRDIRRLVIEGRANEVFPTPESRLAYQVSTALPLYLEQESPARATFSGCSRPMAERAFMLARLR